MKLTLVRELAIAPIRLYQYFISPLLPASCRYYPSCSAYAREAVRIHGLGRGGLLACRRLLRCHPWSAGGHDPVPPASAGLVEKRPGFNPQTQGILSESYPSRTKLPGHKKPSAPSWK